MWPNTEDQFIGGRKGEWLTEPDKSSLVEITLGKERGNKLNGDEDVSQKRGKRGGPKSKIRRHFELMACCLDWQRIFSNLLVLWD